MRTGDDVTDARPDRTVGIAYFDMPANWIVLRKIRKNIEKK